ncbi:hypothetical protein FRX31_022983 [Thalictrum thalictroides]|uniref:Uncharacterized protein n=1 Tax=Thalictrum thalictroides TaxID=46969 RepID=A0A7J6VSU1_THATH|nr:hypothetical protein FRX31_022983 [Thalictrum thalictroides]
MDFFARVAINLPKENVFKLLTNLKSTIFNSLEFINILLQDDQNHYYADDDSFFCLPVSLPVSSVGIVMEMEPIKNKLPVVTFAHFQDHCKRSSSAKKHDLEEQEIHPSDLKPTHRFIRVTSDYSIV